MLKRPESNAIRIFLAVASVAQARHVIADEPTPVGQRSQAQTSSELQLHRGTLQSLNRSSGTWANLENPWDYFPPSDAAGRQKMLRWSAELFQKAETLENEIAHDKEWTKNRQARQNLYKLKNHIRELHRTLLYGAHRGDLAESLAVVETNLGEIHRDLVAVKNARINANGLNDTFSEIQNQTGSRLTLAGPVRRNLGPATAPNRDERFKTINPIGLSRQNR